MFQLKTTFLLFVGLLLQLSFCVLFFGRSGFQNVWLGAQILWKNVWQDTSKKGVRHVMEKVENLFQFF
jgi:hypothetical protein